MQYKIPLFDLNFDDREEKAVSEVIRSGWISTGPKCEEFENQFAAALGAKYAITTSNCTSSLHLAFTVLGLKPGDEVICPSMTFVATVNAIRYVGATPVFADIAGLHDLTIDPTKVRALVTPKTRAIIVMHFAGYPCNMDEILSIAAEYKLKVVEDACHGPLSEYHGKKLGTFGDIGCFSFFTNKNLSTGEGGMIVTNDDELAKRIRLLRSHGMTVMSYQRSKGHATSYDVVALGYNSRMDDLRASIGIVQLSKLRNDLTRRQEIRNLYEECLKDTDGIIVPFTGHKEFNSNYIFPVILANSTSVRRDEVREMMHAAGVQTSIHYPAVHRFSIYVDPNCSLPLTEYVADNEITLPMYSTLSNESVIYICETLKRSYLHSIHIEKNR